MLTLAKHFSTPFRVLVEETNASVSESFAVDELISFVQQVTGAILPKAPMSEEDLARALNNPEWRIYNTDLIVVGKNALTEKLGLNAEIDAQGDEGFIIRTVDEHMLVIAGGRLRGTLYGVYTFLEDYLGCRWYTPEISNIPHRSEVILPEINLAKKPAFDIREAFNMENFDGLWSARNKANSQHHRVGQAAGGRLIYDGVHSFERYLLPSDKYFDAHPDWFALVDGKRVKERTQPCLTNPEVFDEVLKNLLANIKAHPEAKLFSVSQNDWGNYCMCENCQKVYEEEDSKMGTVIRFVNKIDDAVHKVYPDVWIDTLAYQFTRRAPKVTKPNPDVLIRLCTIECCFSHPLYDCHVDKGNMPSNFYEDITAWSKISDHLFIWDYTTDFRMYLMPFANLKVLKKNLQFFKEYGTIGLFEEGCPNTNWSYAGELRNYMLAKLLYDLELDDKLLMDEFLDGVYGSAAGYVRAFYMMWEDLADACGEHMFEDDWATHSYFTKENLAKGRELLNKALTLASSDLIATRIQRLLLSMDFMDMVQMDKGEAKDAAVDTLLAKCKELGMARITEWHTYEQSEELFKNAGPMLPFEGSDGSWNGKRW